MGIQLAYDVAKANFIPGGVNRVILATDGDFNVGTTSPGDLVRLVGEKAKTGVFLTVLGFGMGNYKDGTLEQLADKGNGNYAYIDSLAEAKKTLVEQAGGTLMTIAKDVKLQVEFNPAVVQAYRLIGYENRLLAREDFNNDKVDAGEIGAGHTVTALYEVIPAGAEMPEVAPASEALKYQRVAPQRGEGAASPEMLTVKIRFKQPAADASSLLEFPLRDTGGAFAGASRDFKFAAAVAAFGMVLRDSPEKGASTFASVAAWAREGIGSDAGGYRSEFLDLVEKAQAVGQ
jgi:Ca-activated chloride channel family protein